jgi:hypothetical protein
VGKEPYVRMWGRKGPGEARKGVPDVEDVEVEEEVVLETIFTFEAFEMVCFFYHSFVIEADSFSFVHRAEIRKRVPRAI